MFTYSSTVIPAPLLVIYLPYHQFNTRKPSIYYFKIFFFNKKETYVTGGNSYTFQFLTQGITIVLGQIKCDYVASKVHSLKKKYYQGETPLHVSLERHNFVSSTEITNVQCVYSSNTTIFILILTNLMH